MDAEPSRWRGFFIPSSADLHRFSQILRQVRQLLSHRAMERGFCGFNRFTRIFINIIILAHYTKPFVWRKNMGWTSTGQAI
jgi:hypothetical protein